MNEYKRYEHCIIITFAFAIKAQFNNGNGCKLVSLFCRFGLLIASKSDITKIYDHTTVCVATC